MKQADINTRCFLILLENYGSFIDYLDGNKGQLGFFMGSFIKGSSTKEINNTNHKQIMRTFRIILDECSAKKKTF